MSKGTTMNFDNHIPGARLDQSETIFHGMTEGELRRLLAIKEMVERNLPEAKRMASQWINAHKRRKVIRRMACNTVRGLHS
jgi:hypothetical protein